MSKDIAKEIQIIFEREVVPFCEEAFTIAARKMQQDLKKANVTLTEDLKNSIHSERVQMTNNLEVQLRIAMQGYGRFKDMRVLTFDQFRPKPDGELIGAIEDWVERYGIRRFKYVPGYFKDVQRGFEIPESRAKNRIAWGVAMSLINRNEIKRKARFWNRNRARVYGYIKRQIMTRLPEESLKKLVAYYTANEIYLG